MCFGGGGRDDEAIIIRRRERKQPRYSREYVSRPEVASYRRETVTRRETSGHRPSRSFDHNSSHSFHDPRRSGSRTRVVREERRSRQYYD